MYSPAFIEVNTAYVSPKAHVLIEVIEFPQVKLRLAGLSVSLMNLSTIVFKEMLRILTYLVHIY